MPYRRRHHAPTALCLVALILGCGDDVVMNPPPATGSLAITTASVGSAIDADGYTVLLDGSAMGVIGASDSVNSDVAVGQYEVELTGLADNCGVIGENPVSTTIVEGALVTVGFSVACPPFFDYIAFTWDDIYVMEAEGSIPVSVTAHLDLADAAYLDWSPDGTRLAWRVFGIDGYDLQVMRVDGSEPITIDLPPVFCVHSLEWTPDGTRIGFAGGGENHDVWVVEADGSNLTNLTNSRAEEMEATWSPDGSQIMFVRSMPELGLWVMDADGSNDNLLPALDIGFDLHWSPDGGQILYSCGLAGTGVDVCVMDSDASNPVNLTDHPQDNWAPDWSPDGTRIAFFSRRDGGGIFVMNADGSDVSFLVEGGQPAWSPRE